MRSMRNRGFFDLTWTIFRFAMKSIFVVLSVSYVWAGIVMFLLSPDLGRLPAQQFIVSLASALLFGLVFVSYVTLLVALPVSAFCAFAALAVTGVVRLYETAFPPPPGSVDWGDIEEAEPGAVEVVSAHLHLDEAICPVCAARLDAAVDYVSCLRCESPHHPECWTYMGSCATFGCGSDRARPSKQPAPEGTPEWSGWREKWLSRSDGRTKPS